MLFSTWRWLRLKASEYKALWELLGLRSAIHYVWVRHQQRSAIGQHLFTLRSKHAQYPLWFRSNSSDWGVFGQIFLELEYAVLPDIPAGGFILDCGANIGFSAAYLLSRFPECHLLAVEPDPGNFAILQKNLAPFGKRARAIQAAVWSETTHVQIAESPYRGGLEWSRQVEPITTPTTRSIPAYDIPSLMSQAQQARIDLLKIDIEGAEAVVFAAECSTWLPKAETMVVELHDDTHFGPATEIFHRAIATEGFELSYSVEVVVCQRKR